MNLAAFKNHPLLLPGLVFTVFILGYFLTRLINLTVIPVFVDEAIYTRWTQIIRADSAYSFIPLSDGKQPLFMWVASLPIRVFSDPLWATRFTSVAAGFFGLIGLGLLAREYFNTRVAMISVLFYILCPFLLMYNRLAVPDGMLTTFFIYIILLSTLVARTLRLDYALLLGISIGGGLLTKSTAAIFALLIPGTLLLSPWHKSSRSASLTKLAGLWLVSAIMGILMYSILRLSPLYYLIGQRTPDFIFTPREILQHPLDPFLPRIGDVAGWLLGYLTVPVSVMLVVGAVWLIRKNLRLGLSVLAWFLAPLMIEMEIAKGFTPRYFIFVAPVGLVFASYLIDQLLRLNHRGLVLTAVSLLMLPSLIFDLLLLTNPELAPIPPKEKSGYLEEWSAGYGIYPISLYLRALAKTGEPITIETEGAEGYGTLPDGLEIYLRGVTNVQVLGIGQSTIKKVPENLLESAKIHPTFLVVNQERMEDGGNPHLKLIASYPKANDQSPLLFYRVTDAPDTAPVR